MRRALLVLAAAAVCAAVCSADVPIRTEALIWSVIAANGKDYTATFVPPSSETLFLLADSDNFLSVRKTLLYWWPITGTWLTDTQTLNILFLGTLELTDSRGRVRSLPLQDYTYFNVKGEYEKNWKVLTGDAARAEIDRYTRLYNDYFSADEVYQAATIAYDNEIARLGARIQELKSAGKDYAAPLAQMQALKRPIKPSPPTYYEVPPEGLQKAFIVNLPRGRYGIRLRNGDGTVMEGSEKELIVDGPRRSGGVGFELIPGDKWTRSVESLTPASVIYASGAADLYVRPFFEEEYNDLSYQKTLDNQARGNPSIETWVRIQQVPHATVRITSGAGGSSTLAEHPYYVQQSQGNSYGYTIIPWDPQGPYKSQGPNLIAFRIPIQNGARAFTVEAVDQRGAVLAGSRRLVRVVQGIRLPALLVVLALAPLLAMAGVLLVRRRAYAGGSREGRRRGEPGGAVASRRTERQGGKEV